MQCKRACPLSPRKRTFWGANAMSALVQKRTSAVQAETNRARGGKLRPRTLLIGYYASVRRSFRRILPTFDFGSVSRNRTSFGTL